MAGLAGSLQAAIKLAIQGRVPARIDNVRSAEARAIDAVERILRQRDGRLAAIWGPPGTGKTTVYLRSFADEMDNMEPGVIAAYVAPTNALVAETLGRHVTAVMHRAFGIAGRQPTLRELLEALSWVRVYGSRIYPGTAREIGMLVSTIDCGQLTRDECASRIRKALRDVVHGYPTIETKWVFTTEWQDVARRLGRMLSMKPVSPTTGLSSAEIGLFVDEASRSPLYRPFTTIAYRLEALLASRTIGKQGHLQALASRIDVYGLSVVGDDRQAISVHPYFHLRRDLLILRAVYSILVKLGECTHEWKGSSCAALDVTKRLPKPSHEPISEGFYSGMLKAQNHARERLSPLRDIAPKLRKVARLEPPAMRKILGAVAGAIENSVPVVIIETRSFPPGDTFEKVRAAISMKLARTIARVLSEAGLAGFDIAVSSVYGELAASVRLGLPNLPVRVRVGTVHSFLGDEADIHITMLGKEWMGSSSMFYGLEDEFNYATIYFREPELFNVQLSRHRRLLVIVGSLRQLARSAARTATELSRRERFKEFASLLEGMAKAANELLRYAKSQGTLVRVG